MPRKKKVEPVMIRRMSAPPTQIITTAPKDEGERVIITLLTVTIFCLIVIIGFLFYREFLGTISF